MSYKDQDELDWMVEHWSVSAAQAAHVQRVGAHLMGRATDALWPFDAEWDAWLPDPRWEPVAMPEQWDHLAH